MSAAEGAEGINFSGILKACLTSAIMVVDEQGKVTALNSTAERLINIKRRNSAPVSIEQLPAPLMKLLRAAGRTTKSVQARQIVLNEGLNDQIVLQVEVVRFPVGGRKKAGHVVVFNDISPVKASEHNLRRLDRLHSVGTLSAGMAHEIKNAFVAVRTFVELLLEKNHEADLAGIVRLEMARIDSIVGQLLKFSGPGRPSIAPVHLHFVLDKTLHLIQHLVESKKVHVIRNFNARQDLLEADRDQLEQAFINLFFNALDAMDQAGRLTVTTELVAADSSNRCLPKSKAKSFLQVMVQDSGLGIAKEHLPRLFEPFFTTKPEGTGLGLAMTRRIVQDHQGCISVQSESGRGTTFCLCFPAAV